MFDSYVRETIMIDGYEVAIIEKEQFLELLNDSNVSCSFKLMVERASAVDFLQFGVVRIARYVEKFQWRAVSLYRFASGWEFVDYKKSWLCKNCKYLTGAVLIHQSYCDSFYTHAEMKGIKGRVDLLFPPRRCPQCNYFLQCSPLLLENR